MTTISSKTKTQIGAKFYAAVVVFFFSTMGMFAQSAEFEVKVATETSAEVKSETASQMELLSWFMAVKQSSVKQDVSGDEKIGKKQFINFGMTPNRILSKSFLKKAINRDSTIA